MVLKLPSVRSLSKARSEGDLSENIANADMSASVTEISVSLRRASGMVAKPLRTKRKRASAERCLRPLGATIAMTTPDRKTSNCSGEGRIVACRFTKSQPGGHGDYWVSSPSGNCWRDTDKTRKGRSSVPQVSQSVLSKPETFPKLLIYIHCRGGGMVDTTDLKSVGR